MNRIFRKLNSRIEIAALRLKTWHQLDKVPEKIVFIHVPKCAGMSYSKYIQKCIGSPKGRRTTVINDAGAENTSWYKAINKAKDSKYVSGHISWSTMNAICQQCNPYTFTVLRDPYERLRSLYYFFRNLPERKRIKTFRDPSLSAELPAMTPLRFFTSSCARLYYERNNFMIRQFAGSLADFPRTEEDGQAMLERAKRNLASLDHVGFQETFDEDFPHIIDAIGLPPAKHIPRDNITDNLIASPEERARSREPFSDEVNAAIEPLIRWDRELYEFAVKELRPKQSRST